MSEQQFTALVKQLNAIVGPIRMLAGVGFFVGLWVASMQFQVAAHGAAINRLTANDDTTRSSVTEMRRDILHIRESIDRLNKNLSN